MTASTADRAMLDTNVPVYAYDVSEPARRRVALDLIQRLLPDDPLVLSVQSPNEFYSVVTRPRRPVMPADEAVFAVVTLANTCQIAGMSESSTLLALDGVRQHGLSFWDALTWAVAKEQGVPIVYTEDFQHGRVLDGVRFVNPFLAATP